MKKNKFKKIVTILTVICALIALIGMFSDSLLSLYISRKFNVDTRNARSIGIIGGADGPTSIFLSGHTSFPWFTVIFSLLTVLGVIYLITTKYKEKHN